MEILLRCNTLRWNKVFASSLAGVEFIRDWKRPMRIGDDHKTYMRSSAIA